MVSGRPLLYLSLPGVAFILGVFWYRRRSKNCASSRETSEDETKHEKDMVGAVKECSELNGNSMPVKHTPTESIAMNNNGNGIANDENTKLLGKSAPISIVHNSKTQIDSDLLKNKIQNVEDRTLRSIDEDFENLSSSVDLPDSLNHRKSFYSIKETDGKDKPIVIKATTTPKISPENSFLENKYTVECEHNNNTNAAGCKNSTKENSETDSGKKAEKEATTTTIATVKDKHTVNSASPSVSVCSLQSGDSGKGSSLPRSEAVRAKTTYEFFFPNSLVGQLYGRKRSFINQIWTKSGASVHLRKSQNFPKLRICVVEGSENQINTALLMIRQRLPSKQYPHFTMQRIHYVLPQTIVPLSKESLLNLKLNLIEGINNDVVVCAVISGVHIFVQHPLHPSHPSLAILQKRLYDSYNTAEAPLLPSIEINAVCVMPVNGIWYRVQIVEQDPTDNRYCVVKFLDFGGYMKVLYKDLRQIRSDFMILPFQATECVLSNIELIDGFSSAEAADVLCKLTKGIVLQAQVAGYNANNVPEIYLFACLGPKKIIFINKELVARNLAKWVEIRH